MTVVQEGTRKPRHRRATATVVSVGASDEGAAVLGRVLRRARTRRGWSVREAARRLKLTNTYLSQLERGLIGRPDPLVLWDLASAYQIDFSLLMEWSGQMVNADRHLVGAVLRAFTDLDPAEQLTALDLVRSMADRKHEG